MDDPRYLCSHLVTLSSDEGASVVNLEEISSGGCVLESDSGLPPGKEIEIRCGAVYFAGTVTEAEEQAFGWKISVEFSPATPWTPDRFRPEHLLDVSSGTAARKTT